MTDIEINKRMAEIPKRTLGILKAYYSEDEPTKTDIAADHGICDGRVGQIIAKVERDMRRASVLLGGAGAVDFE